MVFEKLTAARILGLGLLLPAVRADTSRPLYPETALVRAGEAAVVIVHPAAWEGAAYRSLAERIADAIEAKGGARPEILPDTAVTEAQHPVLLDIYRARNLILLGRLGINRAIWGVYNRFLCAVDGYYPGGDGYVVRTAANVYRTGANTIVAGGSSEAGAARAVERLIAHIAATPPDDRGDLVLPWLLDVELGGDCRTVFDEDERRQMARVFPGAPGEDPHNCHPVRRFTENITSWYWSGRESYLDLGLRFLDLLLEQDDRIADPAKRGITGHYAAEFFVRAYDMLDDSGRLGAGRIARTDQAIVDGFDNVFGRDPQESGYRRVLMKEGGTEDEIRPADEIVMGSHQNSMWLADKTYADFILGTMPETPATAALHAEARSRRALYVRGFDALIAERWREDANDTTPMTTLLRYALEMERYGLFFDTGNARRAALYKLMRTANPGGMDIGLMRDHTFRHIDFGIYAAVVASYYGDGEFKQAIKTMPGSAAGFYGQYVNGVHRYRPGPEVKAIPPAALTGATSVPLQPLHYRRMQCALPFEKTYNFASIRGGFGNEDYLLLCGGLDLPGNTIVRLASLGRVWLSHTSDMRIFNQNALYISPCSESSLEKRPLPPAARMEHVANAAGASYISSTLPGYAGTDWNRQIVWLTNRCFVVIDTVTALRPERYLIMANWRPNLYTYGENEKLKPVEGGEGRLEGDRWVVRGDGTTFTIMPAGQDIEQIADAEVDAVTRSSIPVYRQRVVADLEKGESVRIANLLFAAGAGADAGYEVRWAEGGVLVRATGATDGLHYLGPMPAALGRSDAPLVVIAADNLTAFDATTLEVNGEARTDPGPARTREIKLRGRETGDLLTAMWRAADPSPAAAPPAEAARTPSPDRLRREWRYSGAQRPGLITGATLIATNTWDLGRVAELSQISVRLAHELSWEDRNVRGLRWSQTGRVCTQILVSIDGRAESFKPFRGEVADIAVPVMGGYGRITKRDDAFQVLVGAPQPARYVKVLADEPLQVQQYLFYDAGRPDAHGEPMRVQVVALRDKAKPDILVHPDIWPGFRRVDRLAHAVHALDAGGRELWRRDMKWRIFFVRALDWSGTGLKTIFVGSLDNNVYAYDGAGALTDTMTVEGSVSPDLYGPAGGYPLAAAVGLWQPDRTGRRKFVLPRYHRISFLERDGRVEGHAVPGSRCPFWINDVLETGLDFTGDGVEDSVAMATSELIPLTQDVIAGGQFPTVGLPNGGADEGLLSGSPTLAFHLFGTGSTNLFVARRSMIGLYDLAGRKWRMSWAPDTPITAAVALPEQRQILCCTLEGVLWRISLDENLAVSGLETVPVSVALNRFAVLDRTPGTVAAASDSGLFRIDPTNVLTLMAPGAFVDVAVYPSDAAPEAIIAVDRSGAVESYRLER